MKIIVMFRIPANYNEKDLTPLFLARKICDITGGNFDVVCMANRVNSINEKLPYQYGAKNVYQLSDKLFCASDTYATSKVLVEFVNKYCEKFDLIICSSISSFGETGHIPCCVASRLDIPFAICVKEIIEIDHDSVTCKSEYQHYDENIKLIYPALISTKDMLIEEKYSTVRLFDMIAAYDKEVKYLSHEDLQLLPEECGECGSHTIVMAGEKISSGKKAQILDGDIHDVALKLAKIILEDKINENSNYL